MKTSPSFDASSTWVPISQVAAEFGVCLRTIHRWMRDDQIDFPPPVFFHGRNYFRRPELDSWKTATALKFAGATPRKTP
jgi:predicted DNA-binding transcriptional regulator AlpA